MKTIGAINEDGTIEREHYGQGDIFKDWDAYYGDDPKAPCYVPELSDTIYAREDFLEIAGGDAELAEYLFLTCDWQHPETELDQLEMEEDDE